MKTVQILSIITCFLMALAVGAQTNKTVEKEKDTLVKKQNNMMDMLSKTLTGVFGENMDGKSKGLDKGIGYLALLEKSDLSQKQKEEYSNWYYLQSKKMTRTQKDSLNIELSKKIVEAQKNQKQ